MAKNNRRLSFFEEQRNQYNNPNFIQSIDPKFIANNVKRIIRDINENNIIPEDYIYFRSDKLLDICIKESFENFRSNEVILHALNSYLERVLPMGLANPVDMMDELRVASNEHTKAAEKADVWRSAYYAFTYIRDGADPYSILVGLQRFNNNIVRGL